MKRILLVMVMVVLVSTAVSAQLPPQGYFGLFVDDTRANWCITGTGSFTIYLFVLPNVDGMKCIELKTVVSSANIAVFSAVYNPDVAQPIMGGVPGDLAACFGNCYYDWVQVFSATLFLMAPTAESVTMEPFTGSPYMKTLDCLTPANELETIAWTYVYTNYAECPPYANQESTWGAIKNMYQ